MKITPEMMAEDERRWYARDVITELGYCGNCMRERKDMTNLDIRFYAFIMRKAHDMLKAQEPRVMTLEELQAIETPWNRNTPPYLWLEDRFGQNSHWMCWRDIHSVVSSSEATVWKQNYGHMRRVWTLQPTLEQRKAVLWDG